MNHVSHPVHAFNRPLVLAVHPRLAGLGLRVSAALMATRSSPSPLELAMLLATICRFLVSSHGTVLAVEHDDPHSSPHHRAEQMHDAERLLEARGLEVYRETSTRILVLGRQAPEVCDGCRALLPAACECRDAA